MSQNNKASVLIVDDSLFMRNILRDILSNASYEVIAEASDGLEAIEQFINHEPDIVILDIAMPEMDGIAALKEIIKEDPQAKVIMCSALGKHGVVMEAVSAGAADFIIKPFQANKVIEALDKLNIFITS